MADPDQPEPAPGGQATKREGYGARARTPTPVVELARGTLVGRYVVLDRIGAGGMGVVYAAFDPELDRKVAIKVLQGDSADGSSGTSGAWLQREAQALARLQHPNVVAVHDVGTLPGDRVFVAMELVDGDTMRAWLRERRRTWREVVPLARAAGAGLAAAHRAGLVHRDFKPENVLVGRDGRVRVMDFGLARLQPGEVIDGRDSVPAGSAAEGRRGSIDERLPDSPSPLAADLTQAGAVVGTPAYMAAELFAGEPADAHSDQFAFGVVLFEALFGTRPFTREELAASATAPPKPRVPPDARAPARLVRVALRAIAIERTERFASMDELLAELARDPLATRRRAIVAVGAAIVLGGAVVATMSLASSSRPRPCQGIAGRLGGIWDAATGARVRDAYAATKLPFAAGAFADLSRALDGYAREWTATSIDSCEATRVRGDQSEDVLTLRQACLEQRRDGLAALERVLESPTKSLVEKGGKAVMELDPIAPCSNVAALVAQGHPPPELAPKIAEMMKLLAEANAQVIAGNVLAGNAAATKARAIADATGFAPARAQADLIRGVVLAAAQSFDDAAATLSDATMAALEAKRDDLAAYGALFLAGLSAEVLSRPGEAKVWLALGKAAKRRDASADHKLDVVELQMTGVVAALSGDPRAAVVAHEQGLAAARRYYGEDSPNLWEVEEMYAASLSRAREDEQAARHFEHAIAARERVVGAEHPDIAMLLSNVGAEYTHIRDPRARATLEHALAIREKAYGKRHPYLVPTLENLAESLRWQGDLDGALALDRRALAIAAALPGKQHFMYHDIATDYGITLIAAGRHAEARAVLDETIALEQSAKSSAMLPLTEAARGELALAEHAWADAATHAQRSLDAYEAGGKDNPATWWPLAVLGRAALARGDVASGRAALARAIAIADRLHLNDPELVPARAALAGLAGAN